VSEPIVNHERQGSGRETLKLTFVQVKPERSAIEKNPQEGPNAPHYALTKAICLSSAI